MKKILVSAVAMAMISGTAFAACTVDDATKAVEKACSMIKENIKAGKNAYEGLREYRFCNDSNNYVWVQKHDASLKTIMLTYHPVATGLVGQDMTQKDEKIKTLFTNLATALNKSYESGKASSVEYKWAKQGAAEATDKVSVMVKCTDTEGVGGGFWK